MPVEQVRAVMLMVLQNIGQGFSGVRRIVLDRYRDMLNQHVTPYVPSDGSVGYLSIEAHIALTLFGEGELFYQGKWHPTSEVYALLGWDILPLAEKEGLALISGTTSATGLAALALFDMLQAAKTADVIAAISSEALSCNLSAFDQRVMSVRPHIEQGKVAQNLRAILEESSWLQNNSSAMLQDALSIRCIPQLHGAARKVLKDAKVTLEVEMNACCDNPIVYLDEDDAAIISACNADSSYVGIAMDAAAIAATNLAKMSERRNNRLLDQQYSHQSSFLVQSPGLNSGLMIPQYTQAALLNEMRILSTSATIDNTPTCNNQEDYVAMGYNASKKALKVAKNLEYILAIELLSGFAIQAFLTEHLRSKVTEAVQARLTAILPDLSTDVHLSPCIETVRKQIHQGSIIEEAESVIGQLQ